MDTTSRIADHLIRLRWICAALSLVVCGVTLIGLTMTSMNTTPRSLLTADDPYLDEVDRTREAFPPSTSVLFVFRMRDGSSVLEMPALRAMDELHARYTEVQYSVSVGSMITRRPADEVADRLGRDYLFPELDQITPDVLAEIRELALADEGLTESLLAPTGDMALANVKYKAPADEREVRLGIGETVLTLRDSLRENHPDVLIQVVGNVLFELEGAKANETDNQVLFPVVIVATIMLLWFCLRSLSFSLALFVVAFGALLLSIASFGWLDVQFNQVSRLGPIVVLVVGIAASIHVVSVYAQNLQAGLDKVSAMRESLAVNLHPVTLAAITTAMGFLSLNYSSSPAIYGFGNVIAIGVLWAFLLTLFLLPALITLLPVSRAPQPLGVQGLMERTRDLTLSHGRTLLIAGSVVIVATLMMLPLNKLDFDRFALIDQDSDFHQVMEALAEKIGNDRSLVFSLHSNRYYGITEPEFLTLIDDFTKWLEDQPEASFVSSYTDYLAARNKAEHDDDPAYERVPEDKLAIIDYLVGYQLIAEIEPGLEPIFNADYSSVRLIVGTSNLTNQGILDFNERIEGWIDTNVPSGFEVLHGDNSILYARLDGQLARELLQGFSVSFLMITLVMILGLKSLRYGLLSIIPNLFPATIVFGIWGLMVGELSPYILMLFSISIGIVVDDSVHVMSKYISSRREGKTPEASVAYSIDKAGSAITITTLSLATGTLLLMFSNTYIFQNVSMLITPIVVVALLLDLLFLPPLLVRFDGWSNTLLEYRGRDAQRTVTKRKRAT